MQRVYYSNIIQKYKIPILSTEYKITILTTEYNIFWLLLQSLSDLDASLPTLAQIATAYVQVNAQDAQKVLSINIILCIIQQLRDLDETLPLFIEPIKDMLAGGARTNSKVAQYSHTQTMHELSQFPGREGTLDCKLYNGTILYYLLAQKLGLLLVNFDLLVTNKKCPKFSNSNFNLENG